MVESLAALPQSTCVAAFNRAAIACAAMLACRNCLRTLAQIDWCDARISRTAYRLQTARVHLLMTPERRRAAPFVMVFAAACALWFERKVLKKSRFLKLQRPSTRLRRARRRAPRCGGTTNSACARRAPAKKFMPGC
ncbi:MAG: hypothetical protein ACREO8_03100 [Luteimonas sp.]